MKKIILLLKIFLLHIAVNAQVAVSEEPRHHVVYADDKVRLLNVVLPAGDTTMYHLHSTPSVFICFTKTKTGSQLLNQPPAEPGYSTAGSIWFENLNPPHTRTHRVYNVDSATFHVMDIELLAKDSGFAYEPLTFAHAKLAINEPWARVYRATLQKGEELVLPESKDPLLIVAINNGAITFKQGSELKEKTLEEGNFFWIKSNTCVITNKNNSEANFAVLQIK